jgi:hypothetical protein
MSSIDDGLVGNIHTLDGTPIVVPVTDVPQGTVVFAEATIVAVGTDGNCAAWAIVALCKNVNGTPTIVGTPTAILHPADSGATGWTVVMSADSTGLIVTLTGGVVDIDWTVRSHVTVTP